MCFLFLGWMCMVFWLRVWFIVGVALYPWAVSPVLVLFCFCLWVTVRVYSFRFHVFFVCFLVWFVGNRHFVFAAHVAVFVVFFGVVLLFIYSVEACHLASLAFRVLR